MKRTPLNRGKKELKRTPLKAGTKPLPSAKKPMKARSAKTAKKYREERIPLVKRLLEERPWCEACKVFAAADGRTWFRTNPSVDLHEVISRGRSGGVNSSEWLDPKNILCVCRPCHDRITNNKDGEADKLGLLATLTTPTESGKVPET